MSQFVSTVVFKMDYSDNENDTNFIFFFQISVPISQIFPRTEYPAVESYAKAADHLLNIYFTLDPFVYVLQNYAEGRISFSCCNFRKSTSSLSTATTVSAIPNNTQLQETTFINDEK